MRIILMSVCVLFATALACRAQGEMPIDVAEGWIHLFDGETTFGWTGKASITKPANPIIEGKVPRLTVFGEDKVDGAIRCTTPFQEFALSIVYSTPHVGSATIYLVPVDAKEHNAKVDRFVLPGSAKPTSATFTVTNEMLYGKTSTKTDGIVEFPETKRTTPNQPVHLVIASGAVHFQRIWLKPINTKSLFNGKDLTGWTEFPGKKSTFAVVDGAINVKNGPGDLQTTGKYKNFILQLEAISNGKHLNSGIFYRCRDKEYQNGYEAQIFNKFSKEPTQKYTVEEFDPMSHKLLGKKEMMSSAFDFGTGAIYRRVPARKEMSKDDEWFGMTIAAHGNHLATWVNGVQVVDWTDNRPRSDNARTGCKLEPGHLSIQGHDPTTDLSFRNFRIAEMK